MPKIKICGITNIEDALYAANLGVDALGFIFYKKSKRFIEPDSAKKIIDKLPPFITKVGVFVNENEDFLAESKRIAGFDIFQFHGDETPGFCNDFGRKYIKAIRVNSSQSIEAVESFNTDYFLFDTYSDDEYGGTGKTFSWDILDNSCLKDKFVILSGGLNPENVSKAIKAVNPYAVDVSSGVERSPGKKDHEKLKKFIEAVKNETQI